MTWLWTIGAIFADANPWLRAMVPALIFAVSGAALGLYFPPYAQKRLVAEDKPSGPTVQQHIGDIIMNSSPNFGVITHNQSGGINTVNIGPTKLVFEPAIAEDLARSLPAGKPLELHSIGGPADQQIVDEYERFLANRGFKFTGRSQIGVRSPPPEHPITVEDLRDVVRIVIAPSVATYPAEKAAAGTTMFGLKGNFEGLKIENNTLSGPGKVLDAEGRFTDVEIRNNKQDNRK